MSFDLVVLDEAQRIKNRSSNSGQVVRSINRSHRIGAAGPVTVTRMLAVGTIEERINEVLEEKRELFATILSQTGEPRRHFWPVQLEVASRHAVQSGVTASAGV